MKNIAIIAPAGNLETLDNLQQAKSFLENFGIGVTIFPGCHKKFRYMAGNDEIRLEDLHNAYLDNDIDTIICARGGYGAIRLLDKIDYDIIKKHPKKFVGSSDITALLVSIYKNTGQVTYHAKMAASSIAKMSLDEFYQYKNAIESDAYNLAKFNRFTQGFEGNDEYDCSMLRGILWGGNLATIVSLLGAEPKSYVPDEDIILFIEDINEPDYKIDRMLTQILRNKPLRDRIKGVIFGEFIGAGKYLDEILKEFTLALGVPYTYDLHITHGDKNTVVPVGKLL